MLANRFLRTAVTLCGWLLAAVLLSVQFGSKETVLKFEDAGAEERQLTAKSFRQTGTSVMSPSNMSTQTPSTNNVTNAGPGGFKLTPVPAPTSMVILLTYMRSGSSFTGDVIQQHPDVFYWYEPLHALNSILRSSVIFRRLFLDKPPSLYNLNAARNLSLEIIENVLTCQLQNLDINTLLGSHFVGFSSKKLQEFRQCYLNRSLVRTYDECLPAALQACSSSAPSLVKTIRFPMTDAGVLLAKYPSLKIIHLIRDPRPTLYSQSRTGGVDVTDFENGTRLFCARVYADLQESRRLSGLYPGRLMTVRYEDMAEDPQNGVAALYDFVGLEFDSERRQYVRNHTEMGLPDDCVICTLRANSTATANRWRHEIGAKHLDIIQHHCVSVFREMGFLSIRSSRLKDMRYPSKSKSNPFISG